MDGLRPLGEVLLWIAVGAWLLTAGAFLVAVSHRPRVAGFLRRRR
ncbi:hypothetical protein [Kitasatospora sp. NPDC059599]